MSEFQRKNFQKKHKVDRSKQNARAWRPISSLFPPLSKDAWNILKNFPEPLARIRPLKGSHRETLPMDIAELSEILTSRRSELRKSYWSKPAWLSAYLYYFFPWNLIRLTRLLAALPIPAPRVRDNKMPLLLDAGSGPLTLPLALWIARPEWREIPLHFVAVDKARQPLDLGARLFEMLSGPQKIWQPHVACGPIQTLASHARNCAGTWPWLVSAANILNELKIRPQRGHEDDASPPSHDFQRLLEAWLPLWHENGAMPYLLFIEPGTRQGGTMIMNMRETALNMGFKALAPCVGDYDCPLLPTSGHGGSYSRMWCHFTFDADAPAWLKDLSSACGLSKSSLSMSPLLLGTSMELQPTNDLQVRVLSQPFSVPNLPGMAKYGCSKKGLALLENAAAIPSGSLTPGQIAGTEKDRKSGAIILRPAPEPEKRMNKANFRQNSHLFHK